MTCSKPRGVCWCDCHMQVDDTGDREFDKPWPTYDDPVALVTACAECRDDHASWIARGVDPFVDKS